MDYEKQASDLATKLGLELIINKVEHRKHFLDDTDSRDVYNVTLKREDKSYTFDFGQSISKSCNTVKVKQIALVNQIEVFAGFKMREVHGSIKFTLYKKIIGSMIEMISQISLKKTGYLTISLKINTGKLSIKVERFLKIYIYLK